MLLWPYFSFVRPCSDSLVVIILTFLKVLLFLKMYLIWNHEILNFLETFRSHPGKSLKVYNKNILEYSQIARNGMESMILDTEGRSMN